MNKNYFHDRKTLMGFWFLVLLPFLQSSRGPSSILLIFSSSLSICPHKPLHQYCTFIPKTLPNSSEFSICSGFSFSILHPLRRCPPLPSCPLYMFLHLALAHSCFFLLVFVFICPVGFHYYI